MSRKLVVEIIGDASSLQKAFAKSEKSARQFDKSVGKAGQSTKRQTKLFGGLGKTVGLLAGGLGVAGLAGAAKAAFDELKDAQKVTAQTAAVLKSTGGAANVTADHVDDLATSLSNLSGTDDEVIKSGENMLLTFTNVRNEVGKGNDIFDQATETMLDMSVALGEDTKQAALQLGKALNDPIKGVGALRRVGVAFTEDQATMIKKLVDTGHTLEAQKIILRELNKEFGGSAKAAGQTMAGQIDKLKNTLLNLGASILEGLMPTIQKLLLRLNKWLSNSKNQKQILDTVNAIAKALTVTVKILTGAFNVLSKALGGTTNATYALIAAFAAFKTAQIAYRVNLLTAAMVGRAGLYGAILLIGYELSTLIRKIPGWDAAFKAFGAGIYDLAHNLRGSFAALGQALAGILKAPINAAIAGINAIKLPAFKVHIPVPFGPDVDFSSPAIDPFPNIPYLARGGIVRRPTLAVVGERGPEAVVPLGGRGGAGGLAVNHMTVNLYGVQNVRDFEQQIQKRTQARPQTRRGPV